MERIGALRDEGAYEREEDSVKKIKHQVIDSYSNNSKQKQSNNNI